MCWLTETFLNKRTLSKLSAVVAAHQNDWYCSIIQPICRIPITSSDKFDSLLIGFVNIAQLIQQFGSLQIKLVCRHISFQKWNIARGTTDPGYWLFNLSYLSSYSPRRNAKETGRTVQRCCRWGWKALGGTVASAPTPNLTMGQFFIPWNPMESVMKLCLDLQQNATPFQISVKVVGSVDFSLSTIPGEQEVNESSRSGCNWRQRGPLKGVNLKDA